MWVTKLLISPVKIRTFCPKTTKIGPEIGIFGHFGPGLAGSFGGLVSGCGARAVSRKTPFHFIADNKYILILLDPLLTLKFSIHLPLPDDDF